MKEIKVKKGEILQRNGDLNTKVYQVKSGLLRSYTIDKKGKEHIFMFAPEGWLMADTVSIDEPADLFIDVLEDSILELLPKSVAITDSTHNTVKLFNRIKVLQKRVIMLMSWSAIDRYMDFIETYPNITQRVSQRMIASYLGITPEALSAAKRKYFNKKNASL